MSDAVLKRNEDELELDLSPCRGGEFRDAKAKVKDIPGKRFDWDRKLWILPAEPDVAERILLTIQPQTTPEVIQWIKESRSKASDELTTPLPKDAELSVSWATKRMPWQPEYVNDEPFNGLFPWQRAAVDMLARAERAVLADDMGLGKTIQSISAVEEWCLRQAAAGDGVPIVGPRLVICPNSVKGSWARELTRWLEEPHFQIIDGSSIAARHNQLERAIQDNAWAIVNWEQIRTKKEKIKLRNGGTKTITVMKEPLFEKTDWLAVIADEVHRAKNRKAQQTMGLWRIQAPLMFGLSGTPLMNSPDELWAILRWLYPQEYTSYWRFYEQYVDYWEGPFGKVITGVKNPDALRFELKGRLVRRTASILGLKGRKRIYQPLELNPKQQKLYDEAVHAMWLEIEQQIADGDESAKRFAEAALAGENPSVLYRIPNGAARMTRLQQLIESPALLGGPDDSAVLDYFEQMVEDSRPQQWVISTKFKPTCDLLRARLEKKGLRVAVYNGDVAAKDRTQIEDDFQAGRVDVIVGTLETLKEGITLTSGNHMGQTTRDFVPDWNE
jgi:SNF2 family DNA or RNA helicase